MNLEKLIIDYCDETINQIDIIAETLLSNESSRNKIDQINLQREIFIKEIRKISRYNYKKWKKISSAQEEATKSFIFFPREESDENIFNENKLGKLVILSQFIQPNIAYEGWSVYLKPYFIKNIKENKGIVYLNPTNRIFTEQVNFR